MHLAVERETGFAVFRDAQQPLLALLRVLRLADHVNSAQSFIRPRLRLPIRFSLGQFAAPQPLAIFVVEAAVKALSEMATFTGAGVSERLK